MPLRVSILIDTLSHKCKHLFEELQRSASHALCAHACPLSRVISEAPVPGNDKSDLLLLPAGSKTLPRAFCDARSFSVLA